MRITSTPIKNETPDFWIARVGQCGKVLTKPYTANNSFCVYSEAGQAENDFQKAKAAYDFGLFAMYANGTCQPAIRIGHVREVLASVPDFSDESSEQLIKAQRMIATLEKQIELYKKLQKAHQFKAMKG